ncbi:XRE family transcriptional regulator [Campylobacter ureolyticus]|uniref:XRE family transcriptional regulator n=2 Tax=Campylobacter ureolyticus TaxID=827 RepID=A0A9Q4PVJ9_9BACT|nr:XRE family transcriptional regulator [Campylobacter ureolyticus]MCZ6161979.1 XRE family transcriptional regulator [Campylobacter ureolyticus]MCZ6170945.1 XRE family transcriptional regulator [Campylobacter ureolyticus]
MKMSDENIIKKVCKELNLTYKQLGELIGYSEGRLKQLAITEPGEQVEKVCKMLLKVKELEAEINKQNELKKLLKDFIG